MPYEYAPAMGGTLSGSINYPGLIADAHSMSWELHYREALKIEIASGDIVKLENADGASCCLIVAFATDYETNDHRTNNTNGIDALNLSDLKDQAIDLSSFNSAEFYDFLSTNAMQNNQVLAKQIFSPNAPAGEAFTFNSTKNLTVWLIFPQLSNTIMAGGGGTVLAELMPYTTQTQPQLPEPLDKNFKDYRVKRASAIAYTVKKGEFIQVIDVEGRQCSDFMAVRMDALAEGEERYIDSTVTRTLVRAAYPGPGLFDKFFDQDMQPLLAVIQDTVGRHDTFALACTARGYEERGFPGHLNCSDNISNAYQPYGIKAKAAWPAINFFFNSHISINDNSLVSDEAWSRPGDYVVMQALTDLVCVSTACPDDIDPINGWNPTDIHVRVYSKHSHIPKAISYRPFVESQATMTIESAFHPQTSQLTQSYQVARDLWLPSSYEGTRAIEEYWACSQAVTIQDMSSLRKYDVMGPDAEKLLQLAMTRDIAKLSENRGVYALICSDTGSVIDDGTLFRLAPDVFRWCCGSEESARQLKSIAATHNLNVWIKALWSAMPNLAIQGPNSRELLARLVFTQPSQPSLANLKWFGFTIARLHDRDGPAFMLTRSGFTGELGYEIFCDHNSAGMLWDTFMAAGADLGITPMGLEALEIKRIEAGLMAAGTEFTPDVDAFEAGLGFAVDLNKTDFNGREALLRNSQSPRRKLVGLMLNGNEVPPHGAPIFADRIQIGTITSATRSPELQKTIAFARVAVEHSELNQILAVGCLDGHLKRLTATVCNFPFVDPKRERARA